MADLAFTAVSSVRKAVNTGSVTRKARIVVMQICPSFLSPLILFLSSVIHCV